MPNGTVNRSRFVRQGKFLPITHAAASKHRVSDRTVTDCRSEHSHGILPLPYSRWLYFVHYPIPQLALHTGNPVTDEIKLLIRLSLSCLSGQRASPCGFYQWQDDRYVKEENRHWLYTPCMHVSAYHKLKIQMFPLAVMVATYNGVFSVASRPVALESAALVTATLSSHSCVFSDMAFRTCRSFCRITALPQLADTVATTPGDEVVRGIRLLNYY